MQAVAPILPSGIRAGAARGEVPVHALAVARDDAGVEAASAPVESGVLPRGGLRLWDPQLNRQFAGAQQALSFLDDLGGQLRSLKDGLVNPLVHDPAALDAMLQRLDRTWRDRHASSGGGLSAQLVYSATEPAEQSFTVRGLSLRTLQSGERETLSFAVDSVAPGLPTVLVEPGLPDDLLVQRFDRALAAARIRVREGEQGSLVFSTPEAAWDAVRDSLAIKGDGIRFPTGQFNRLRTDPRPEALQPQSWTVTDANGRRQTLQRVLQAMDAVQQTRETVANSLADAGRRLYRARPADERAWAERFAAHFASLAREPGYEAFASIGASLSGVHRERVHALLDLR